MCGQVRIVPSCNSHSAGILYPSDAGVLSSEFFIGFGATILEEHPAILKRLHTVQITLGNDHLLLIPCLCKNRTVGSSDEGATPECNPVFAPDAVERTDVDTVRRRMTELRIAPHQFPVS